MDTIPTADARDDFTLFADTEHMFYGLSEPYGMIREEVEGALGQQVPETNVLAIRGRGEPKFLTLGREIPGDESHVTVGHFAFCFQCEVDVESPQFNGCLDSTVTFLFCDIDRPDDSRMRMSMDIGPDSDDGFAADTFEERFLIYRDEAE